VKNTNQLKSAFLGEPLKQGLHMRIAEYFGVQIMNGEYAPGTVFPTEAALGTSLGVSRTAIREAIKVLASKGLVEVRRKTGTRVRPIEDWNSLDPDVISWKFSDESGTRGAIRDLTELRRIIEPVCAYLAAQRANKDQIIEIEKALNDMESAAGKTEATVDADLRFHLAILDATHNSFMRPFGALIQAGLRASFRLTNADKEAYRRSLVKHRTVYTAIQSGSAQQAEEAMHAVLRGSHRDIERSLDGKKDKTSEQKKAPGTKPRESGLK
jgi:DNA-binding FadR family transcriptional regulator